MDSLDHCNPFNYSHRENHIPVAQTSNQTMSNTTYDRASEIKAFDETKAGVKGLIDAGITQVPRFFIHPTETISTSTDHQFQIPVIDMKDLDTKRKETVEKVREASETFGFFQVANHGVPKEVMDKMLDGIKRFMEDEIVEKKKYYTRDPNKKVRYNSNFHLYTSPAANWRDTMSLRVAPEPPEAEEIPSSCREIVFEYSFHMQKLGDILFELLSEALGLKPDHLKEMEFSKGIDFACHYYPPCPEPHLTLGTSKHSDPCFLTILLQDKSIGGLQVLHQNQWIDVPPSPGCLVINVADLLQLVSNGKLKSVEHRVLANKEGPRLSVACFFGINSGPSSRPYGPIKELLTDGRAPIYKQVSWDEFAKYFNSKGLDGKSALDPFKL